MTSTDTNKQPQPRGTPIADKCSIWLAVATMLGLILWVIITHYRGVISAPAWWYTASVPIWAALVTLGLQMLFLVASAVTATRREQMGLGDMVTSILLLILIVIICVLYVVSFILYYFWDFSFINYGSNQVSGIGAFLWSQGVETLATIGVWMVANRRPGGVIGGLVS